MRKTHFVLLLGLLAGCNQGDKTASPPASPASAAVNEGQPANASNSIDQMADLQAIKNAVSARIEDMAELKVGIAEHYAQTGAFPGSCEELGLSCTSDRTIEQNGVMVMDLSSLGDASLTGKSVRITPQAKENGDVMYVCTSDAPPRYLPTACINR